jgi:HEAT repeat protein
VAIQVSASKEIDALVANLGSRDAVSRDAAVARLIVIGARAVIRLLAATQADRAATARLAAWRALDAIGEARALGPALRALDDPDPAVAAAAAALTRRFVRCADGATVVDRLTAVVLDRRRADVVRASALQALGDLDPAVTAPLRQALASEPNEAPRESTHTAGRDDSRSPQRDSSSRTSGATRLTTAVDRGLPDDATALRKDILAAAGDAPLPLLAQLIDRIREREGAEAASARPSWTMARAAAHLALARRGSRLALYDLRETLESARAPLPVEMLQAVVLVGDATTLESITAAHANAQDPWSRRHLADAFYAIVERERLTVRSAVLRKLAKRWPALARRAGWSGRPGGRGRSGKSGRSD